MCGRTLVSFLWPIAVRPLSPRYTSSITAGHRASPGSVDITHLWRRRCRPLSESRERVRNYNDGRNERSRKIRHTSYSGSPMRSADQSGLIYCAISMHAVSMWTLGASINTNYWLVLGEMCQILLISIIKLIFKKMRERKRGRVLKFWM